MEKNQKVIVRSGQAGVFFGTLADQEDDAVTLTNVRKLWYWSGAAAVEQLALDGVKNPGECKFTVVVPEMIVLGVCQIIPCTEESAASIEAVEAWKM